jgi:hypothetical protein
MSAGNVNQYLLLSFLIARLLYLNLRLHLKNILKMQASLSYALYDYCFAIPLLLFSIKYFL